MGVLRPFSYVLGQRGGPSLQDALELEQLALDVEAATVATERAAAAEDAVAGDDDRDRVGAERGAGRSERPRAAGAESSMVPIAAAAAAGGGRTGSRPVSPWTTTPS